MTSHRPTTTGKTLGQGLGLVTRGSITRRLHRLYCPFFFIPPIPPISPLRAEHPLERVTRTLNLFAMRPTYHSPNRAHASAPRRAWSLCPEIPTVSDPAREFLCGATHSVLCPLWLNRRQSLFEDGSARVRPPPYPNILSILHLPPRHCRGHEAGTRGHPPYLCAKNMSGKGG